MPYNLFAGYQAGALILPGRIFKSWTPQKIIMVKIKIDIVPAAHTTVAVVDAVWSIKLANRQSKTAYQYYGYMRTPGQPA